MNQVRYSCTSLIGTNKAGNLPVDENGYYTMVVGALNMFNSAGLYYTYEAARDIFENSSSAFQRRVGRGVLRGEYGHPKMEVGQTMQSFMSRILAIYEERCCCHHKEIWLDWQNVKDANGSPIIAIMSKVFPSGPYGHVLEKSLKNNGENVCFSIRSLTDDYMDRGIVKRDLKTVVTFDYVNEPGMHVAEKYKSPALESMSEEYSFNKSTVIRAVNDIKQHSIGMESAAMTADELCTSLGWGLEEEANAVLRNVPAWKKW